MRKFVIRNKKCNHWNGEETVAIWQCTGENTCVLGIGMPPCEWWCEEYTIDKYGDWKTTYDGPSYTPAVRFGRVEYEEGGCRYTETTEWWIEES